MNYTEFYAAIHLEQQKIVLNFDKVFSNIKNFDVSSICMAIQDVLQI